MSTAAEVEKAQAIITAYGEAFAKAGAAAYLGPREKLAESIARITLEFFEDPEWQPQLLEAVRIAVASDEGAEPMRKLFSAQVFAQAGVALDEDPLSIDELAGKLSIKAIAINASASQLWGVFLWRYVLRVEPIASASVDEIVELLTPTVERYIIG
ncbi:TetR/AcrR family transcriptional regulator [Streptomyces xanthophaeus]|uniref:TetR/AcrR family transcriptional regulator n=1 Tax=Streptomyces xanthophaeus TaxID=67385 RepID=UPI00364E18DD